MSEEAADRIDKICQEIEDEMSTIPATSAETLAAKVYIGRYNEPHTALGQSLKSDMENLIGECIHECSKTRLVDS